MPSSTDGRSSAAPAVIEALVARLLDALRRHDARACAALFTADGLILSPYGPVAHGTSDIAATHQSWFDEGETNKRLTVLDAGTSGDLGFCVLAYAGDYRQSDGSLTTHTGKSVNILRKDGDGSWKIHISSLNADPS